jgi:glycogen operon protein
MLLSGDTIDVQSFEGAPIRDDTFLLLINAHHEPLQFVLPGQERVAWQLFLDTASDEGFCKEPQDYSSGDDIDIEARATMLLKLVTGSTAQARHESWKKRQFTSPHNGEATGTKEPKETAKPSPPESVPAEEAAPTDTVPDQSA